VKLTGDGIMRQCLRMARLGVVISAAKAAICGYDACHAKRRTQNNGGINSSNSASVGGGENIGSRRKSAAGVVANSAAYRQQRGAMSALKAHPAAVGNK